MRTYQVSGGAPGSMHDSQLFGQLAIGHSINPSTPATSMIPPCLYLIGDTGYPSDMNVLVPYPSIATIENEDFNFIHSSTRMIVEQSFGRLKNRFWLLLTTQSAHPVRARNNCFVCMILHNILNWRGTLYLQAWEIRTASEGVYNEVPGTQYTPEPSQYVGRPTMSAIRDRIRDDLCI